MENSFSKKIQGLAKLLYYKNEKYLRAELDIPLLKKTYVKGVRESQIDSIINFTSPIFSPGIFPNIYAVGNSGTGKTITVMITLDEVQKQASLSGKPFSYIRINCSEYRTSYKALFYLLKKLGYESDKIERNISSVKDAIYKQAKTFKDKVLCILLDEVDRLKDPDDLLYYLSDSFKNNTNFESFLILITNVANFYHVLDPSVKSRLGCRELLFPPYNALELKEILKLRAEKALIAGVYDDGLLEKCAAYAARDYGDARKALDLLYYSVEIAKELRKKLIKQSHLDLAADRLESEKCLNIIKSETKQTLIVFSAIIDLLKTSGEEKLETSKVFSKYIKLCKECGTPALTQRSISDILTKLDMLGLISAKIISKGRFGRDREIYLTLGKDVIEKAERICRKELGL